jgi:hypothetical protein
MHMRRLTLVLALLIATAAPALAQDDKRYDINIGGGVMFPATGLKDEFNTGGNFSIGGTYFFTPTLGFQGQYAYDRMNGPEKTIFVSAVPGGAGSAQLIQSNQQINSGEFDIVGRSKQGGSIVGFYGLGGLGVYHRQVQLTSPAVGYTTICDPYWYVCYPAAVSVDNILGSRGSTDFGINFGRRDVRPRGEVLHRGAVSLRVGPDRHGAVDAHCGSDEHDRIDQRGLFPAGVRRPLLKTRGL